MRNLKHIQAMYTEITRQKSTDLQRQSLAYRKLALATLQLLDLLNKFHLFARVAEWQTLRT